MGRRNKNAAQTESTPSDHAEQTDAPEVGGMEGEAGQEFEVAQDTQDSKTAETSVAVPPAVVDEKSIAKAEYTKALHDAQEDRDAAQAKFDALRKQLDALCETRDAKVNAIDRLIGETRGEVERLNQALHQKLRPAVDRAQQKLSGLNQIGT